MTDEIDRRKALVIRHAQLTAALASGNKDVVKELQEIEAQLGLRADEIAQLAIDEYSRAY